MSATLDQAISSMDSATAALIAARADLEGKKAAIDAATAELKAQAEAAMQATRVYARGGVTRANSVVQYAGNANAGDPAANGVWIVKTPIPIMSDTMVRFDVKGYDYGEAKIIDFSVVTYIYQLASAPDGTKGYFVSNSVQRRGNTTKSGIWLAEDAATNKACLVFGTPQASNYFVSFVLDATFHLNVPSTNPNDWSVACNNSAGPAAGATTGFGLVNLLTL